MPKSRKPLSLSDLLRSELAAAPSVNAIAKALDLSQPLLSRFLNAEYEGMSLEAASKLLDHFGYVVAKPAAPAKSKAKPRTTKRRTTKRKPPKV